MSAELCNMGQAAQIFSRLRRKGGHLRRTPKKLEKSCTYISLMAVTVAGALAKRIDLFGGWQMVAKHLRVVPTHALEGRVC